MQTSRTLGILFLFAALGAAAIWFLGFQGGQADPVPSAMAAVAGPGAPGAAAPEAVGGGALTEDVTTRVAAPALVGSANGAIGVNRGLTGQVLDDQGAPVVGALVRCSPGWGEGPAGGENFDFADLEDFDPAAMMERFRTTMKDRTDATTDADGRFRLAAVGTGRNVGIRVTARHFVVLDKNVPRPTEADADLGVLTVKRGALVSGRVLDRSGAAIVGARVQRADRNENNFGMGDFEFPGAEEMQGFVGDEQAVTDAEGHFELAHIAPGDFSLRARHVDHPIAKLDGLTAQPGATLEGLLVVVEPGVTISGRITGVPEGQKPLRVMASVRRDDAGRQGAGAEGMLGMMGDAGEMMADAGFGFGEKQIDTAADFTFTLRGLQVGKTYRVWASQNGRGFAGNSMCTQRIEVVSGTSGNELRFDAGITVTFQVQDSKSGAPIERLWVKDQLRGGGGMEDMMAFLPRGGRSKTYPAGMVTIASLRPKKKQLLNLTVEATGYAAFERKDIVLPTTGTLDLGLLKFDPAPVVQVTVTSEADGRPVAGATVRLTEASKAGKASDNPFEQVAAMVPGMGGGGSGPRTGKTDAQGRCDLNAFPAAMVVAITSKEHAPYNSSSFESSGVRTSHQAVLLRGGAVDVTVLDSEGKPLASTRVDHTMPSGERDNRETDKQGIATFERLAPGEHRFRLGKRGGGMPGMEAFQARMNGGQGNAAAEVGWQSAKVDDGARVALSLSKAVTASLRGLVRENGVPLVGARVAFVEGAEDRNADGGLEQRIGDLMGEMGGGAGGGARGRNGRTGADGSYQLSELPEGLHRLRISTKERVMPAVVQVSLRGGENVFDVELDATVLRGIVTDGTGAPVAGAVVSIVPVKAKTEATDERAQAIEEAMTGGFDFAQMGGGAGRSQVKSGVDGSYELRGLQPGKPVQVKASAKGFAAAMSAVVELAAGGTKDGVDIALGASGKVKVEVAEAGPFAQARATKVQADGTVEAGVAPVSQLMRNGKCTLDGLRPGRWKVEVRGMQSSQREPLFVEVAAGETATLNF